MKDSFYNPSKQVIITCLILAFLCFVPFKLDSSGSKAAANYNAADQGMMSMLENHIQDIYYGSGLSSKGLSYHIFKFAITGYYNTKREGLTAKHKKQLTIIDFSKPSSEKRLYVIDLGTNRILNHTWVAHGKNSGLVYARRFSNYHNSYQSSLGFFKTENTYYGNFGYSLRIDGLDVGFNHNAKDRSIVIHGAPYVGYEFVKRHGSSGLSWGCPALPLEENRQIIDRIKMGSCLFAYSDNLDYLNSSKHLNFYTAAQYYNSTIPRYTSSINNY